MRTPRLHAEEDFWLKSFGVRLKEDGQKGNVESERSGDETMLDCVIFLRFDGRYKPLRAI